MAGRREIVQRTDIEQVNYYAHQISRRLKRAQEIDGAMPGKAIKLRKGAQQSIKKSDKTFDAIPPHELK